MSTEPGRAAGGAAWLRARLFWTAVLVLICLGGAGLAAAVDRPQTDEYRPELSAAADELAAPWLATMVDQLSVMEPLAADLSAAALDLLVDLSTVDLDAIDETLAAGDAALLALTVANDELLATRAAVPAGLDSWRMGDNNRRLLETIDTAIAEVQDADDDWRAVLVTVEAARQMLVDFTGHDELVLEAVSAGSQARWQVASDLLADATARLDSAVAAGEQLAGGGETPALDALAADLRAYDTALAGLYGLILETGSASGPEVDAARAAVDDAQVPLPTTRATLAGIIAETVGPPLAAGLTALQEVRGAISNALEHAAGPTPEAEQAPEDEP